MAIRVTLSSGITSAKTTSLFQWDYGQQLEIVSDDLPPVVEVHFACKGMSEAVVMPCSITDGSGIVTIPDSCLEQSTDITAWVYSIEGTQGKTLKTITIPIVARIRPGRSETIPQGFSDQYTELISQINDAIGALRDGTVIVKKAEMADTASKSTSATNAVFANTATGVSINGKTPFQAPTEQVTKLPGAGYYCIEVHYDDGVSSYGVTYWDGHSSGIIFALDNLRYLGIDSDGTLWVCYSSGSEVTRVSFRIAKLWG